MLRYVYIDGRPFPMYVVMGVLGYLVAILIVLIKRRAFRFRIRDVMQFSVFAAVGILGGANALSTIVKIARLGDDPDFWKAKNLIGLILGAGWVFYGGLLGGFGLLALLAKFKRVDPKSMFNAYAYVALAFVSFARLGCWCAGCCYGIELSGGSRFPVQLVEAGFCFSALFVFLILKPERRRSDIPLFPVYLITYSAGRFVLEFFRGDANRGVWILSTSQWIGLALIAVAVVWLRRSNFTRKLNKIAPLPAREKENT